MDIKQVLPYAIAGGVTFTLIGLYHMFFGGKSDRTNERLREMKDPTLRSRNQQQQNAGGMANMLERAAPKLSRALEPKSDLETNVLKMRLANAGFNSPNAYQVYLAIKVAALGVGLVLGAAYGLPQWGFTQNGLMSVTFGGCLGFYIPEIVLTLLKSSRQEKIFLQMPDALDLLVVCTEAGLGLDAAMRRVSEELQEVAPEVCSELHTANMQLQVGKTRRNVLRDLGLRTGVDDMRALAAILIQADKFGSSVAQALRVQSDSMRVKRSQMAEEKAQKTAVKMLFPLVLFIFPGIFVVLVGPAAVMLKNNLLTV